nr:ribonuclease H-like domain-containing protein [Tanacetum cinerariifolium]
TPVDTESKLGSDGDPISDPTLYRNLAVAFGLQLHASSTAQLTAYTYADWARCRVTHQSTLGYCVSLVITFCPGPLSDSLNVRSPPVTTAGEY